MPTNIVNPLIRSMVSVTFATTLAVTLMATLSGCKTIYSDGGSRSTPGSSEIILAYDPKDPATRTSGDPRKQADAVGGQEIVVEKSPASALPETKGGGDLGFNLLTPFFRAVLPSSEIEIIMSDHLFAPNDLVLEVGKTYTIELTNDGKVLHYFGSNDFYDAVEVIKIRKAGSFFDQPLIRHIPVQPGATKFITFATKQTGTYGFVCAVPTHKAQGMIGRVTIINPGEQPPES